MVQGSVEWHAWRRGGVGASEIAAVMGVCPYRTPYGVWLEKTGRAAEFKGNVFTAHGRALEPRARALYESLTGRKAPPTCIAHPRYPVCRASLDGWVEAERLVLEIKCPLGLATIRAARDGQILESHLAQVHYQMAVAEASQLDFFVLRREEHVTLSVKPDVTLQKAMFATAINFWDRHVVTDFPPPLTDRDVMIVDSPQIVELCEHLKAGRLTLPKHKLEFLKERVIRLAGHSRVQCGDVQITSVVRGENLFYKLAVG